MYSFFAMLVMASPIIFVSLIAVLIIHRRATKTKRIQQENERAVFEKILSSIDHDSERLNIPTSKATQGSTSGQRIKMSCTKCGSAMELETNQQVIFCPYCGAKELIIESDSVKEARINAEMNERLAAERRKTANELYQQYRETVQTNNHERRIDDFYKLLKTVVSFVLMLGLTVLLVIGIIRGFGLLIEYMANR